MLQNNFKPLLKLKVFHSLVVPQLQCRADHLYVCVVMEMSLSFTQTVTHTASPFLTDPCLSQETAWHNRPGLNRDTIAFWGCDRAQCKVWAKHTWTAQPSMICCLLFLSSVSALHSSLAGAARLTQHTDTVRKANPRCSRELRETVSAFHSAVMLLKEGDRQYT